MLKSLIIHNYALIDQLHLDFDEGFTAITGETGAGKSILLGALALLLGKRADFGVLRDKDKKCVVEGVFDVSKLLLNSFFADNDIDFEPHTILRREIIPSGRSRAFINDTPVHVELLKELGDQLVDIHSQHQTQMLTKTHFQLDVLDSYCGNSELIGEFSKSYHAFRRLNEQLEIQIRSNEQAKRDEEYIRFQLTELESLKLNEEEMEAWIERENFLVHAEEVITEIGKANRMLSEDDETIIDKLNSLSDGLGKIASYYSSVDDLVKRINALIIELKDIESEISHLDNEMEFDPGELRIVTEKLDDIYKLQKKHSVNSVKDLIDLRERYRAQLDSIDKGEDDIQELKTQISKVEAEALKQAENLHQIRFEHASSLGEEIVRVLKDLGMKNAGFEVVVEKQELMTSNGLDKVFFLFDANKSKDLGHISKVASGGELSRLMLAIKSLITAEHFLPTIIFDEIDSGVSGEVAGKVGLIIRKMAVNHQVIAITHLPQIASKADQHLRVVKISVNDMSETVIQTLDTDGRIDEIAKLLSDEVVSESAKTTAKELLLAGK